MNSNLRFLSENFGVHNGMVKTNLNLKIELG